MSDARLHTDWAQACQQALTTAMHDVKRALEHHAETATRSERGGPTGQCEGGRPPVNAVPECALGPRQSGVGHESDAGQYYDVEDGVGDDSTPAVP